jgi:probable F420-dependent oxidoreductase
MQLGFFLPQIGSWTGPEAVSRVAKRAEEVGFDSLWVTERLLWPLDPKAPYPAGDGTLPEVYKTVLDPLETLSYTAAQTTRIGLGTSIVNLPLYNPVLLARRLTTIDVLSHGRLQVGFGQGWSPDEYVAAGASWETRGKRYDEALQVLEAIWTTDPVEFDGDFYSVPRSHIFPKPVQKPHPPIYMAAYTPAAMARVARYAQGWHPVGIPLAYVPEMFEGIKTMAAEAGRDATELKLVMRGNVEFHDAPLGDDRPSFAGTVEQVTSDIAATREMGAAQLIIDVTFDPGVASVDDFVERLELVSEMAAVRA